MRAVAMAGAALLILAASPVASQAPNTAPAENAELRLMFEADQAAREDIAKIVPMELFRADAERRKRTHALLEAGLVKTADDFYHAAFIFQHGGAPDDYLLAHTLAIASIAEGNKGALWIASATLDRYLQEIHQPQIYGTQYSTSPIDARTTQEPYNRSLVSDSLRKVLGVPVRQDQEKRRAEIEARDRARIEQPTGAPK